MRPRKGLGFFGDDNGAAVVIPAIGACTVQELVFVAIGALCHGWSSRFVVRAAFGSAGFRVSSFWIRHVEYSFDCSIIYQSRESLPAGIHFVVAAVA
jgi:hypothetical protein